MIKIPSVVIEEMNRLSSQYSSLHDLYDADVEWLINGTHWLSAMCLEPAMIELTKATAFA